MRIRFEIFQLSGSLFGHVNGENVQSGVCKDSQKAQHRTETVKSSGRECVLDCST